MPAGDVMVSFRADVGQDEELPVPQNLELVISAPSGVPQPSVTEQLGTTSAISGTPGITSYARQQVKVAHIAVGGDYTITTNGNDGSAVNPRLAFRPRQSLQRFSDVALLPGPDPGQPGGLPDYVAPGARTESDDGPAVMETICSRQVSESVGF